MKLIKGKYKKELKKFEDIRDYDFNDYDYFIQDNGNFTYSLNYVYYNEDEETYVIENVCNLPQDYSKRVETSYLKAKIKEHIGVK